ncbi:MAG: hypothetical protein Q7T33_00715 [Dehalococcoidia bacterium]|nr:hypothetical protein [Dehalococcoidia bacterium]
MVRQLLVITALCAVASLAVLVISGPGARIAAVTGTAELANWGFDTGGGESSSDSYGAGWTTGELALGEATSENFSAEGGFRTSALCFDDNDGLDAAAEAALGTSTCAFDSDVDGLGDAADACPTLFTSWLTPLGDGDCDAFLLARESFLGTNPADNCPATGVVSGTPGGGANDEEPDAWPVDINDDQRAGLSDILAYIPVFGTTGPDLPYKARYDVNADNNVGLQDILMFIPFFNRTCTP